MLAKCVRRCWDSQTTRRYYIGMIEDLPESHIFLTMKTPCFVPLTAEDMTKSQEGPGAKVAQMAALVADLTKKVESLEIKKVEKADLEKPFKAEELIPEEKRPVGRPPKVKE